MAHSLNIAIAQLNATVGALDHNYSKICDSWDEAEGKSDLVIFPELFLCGYPPEDMILKPAFLDEVERYIDKLILKSKSHECAALIPAPRRCSDPATKIHDDIHVEEQVMNAAYFIHMGEVKDIITKQELPNYGVFDEKRIFSPGATHDPITFKGVKLGILICEDFWYKKIDRELKDKGAELIIVPNGSPYALGKLAMRRDLASERARMLGLPVLYVNLVGGQDELVFDGGSFVMDGGGQCLHQAACFEEALDHVSFPLTGSEQPLPADDDGTVYQALKLGLKDYVGKNGFSSVLLGLSGGIDSALSAVIAADALGPERVRAVMLPSRYTSEDSLNDARELARNIGITLETITIAGPFTAFEQQLSGHLPGDTPGITFENIQPRIRGITLMALSNATGALLLTTGNKSEVATGYSTLYGDMCGGFNPIKDIYKTQVYALCRWRNREEDIIPENILTKAPTAELKENQRDQDTLPPYEELDRLLYALIEEDCSVKDLADMGFDTDTVKRVWAMIDRAEYKRRQSAPGTKISIRAFGRDRRYPITNHFLKSIENSAP